MTDTLNPFCSLNHAVPEPPARSAGTAAAAGPPVFHTVGQVARALGVSPKTVQRRIRDGVIRKVAMGGRLVRIPSSELRRLAAKYQCLSKYCDKSY
jgi:excisionase family DNA binding protein